MGMPEIPEGKYRPSGEELMIDLLESVALEGMAISHTLNAQGEHLQAAIAKYRDCQLDFAHMAEVTRSSDRMLTDLIMKEWLLMMRFRQISDLAEHFGDRKTPLSPPTAPCPAPQSPASASGQAMANPAASCQATACACCERRHSCPRYQRGLSEE